MKYSYQTGVIVPFAQRFYKQLTVATAGLFVATSAIMTLGASAAPLTVNGCNFTQTGNKWKLTANCTATAQINLPAGTRLDGNNKTITAGFQNGTGISDNTSNNSLIGIINADNVRVKGLTLDGTGGANMYGINVYQSQNVKLDDVKLKNNTKTGLGVNGSFVTVDDISTSGNRLGAINVDQGSGVTTPSILTVKGRSKHTDTVFVPQINTSVPVHIYVDDMNKQVQVNDVRNQYSISHPGAKSNDRLYTLKPVVNNHHDDDDHDD